MERQAFDWIEFYPRPKKDGLHDSGYRYIQLTGVRWPEHPTLAERGALEKVELNQWADHVLLFGAINIDVEPDGTIRLMNWSHPGRWTHDGFMGSTAQFGNTDWDQAVQVVQMYADIERRQDEIRG